MEERQQKILKAVIEEYKETAWPVSSRALSIRYSLRLSSATIRTEMADLTEQGYLVQPYVSAGRLPTDRAYRFFISKWLEESPLNRRNQAGLRKKVNSSMRLAKKNSPIEFRRAAELAALLSHSLSLVRRGDMFFETGLSWLLREPEFKEQDQILNLVDSFAGMRRILIHSGTGEVRVLVGQDDLGEKLKDCSLVAKLFLSRDGERLGLGILGPKRMNYAKNVSIINYLSEIL